LPAYCATIRRARRRTNLVLRTAIQVEAVRADGWVDFPCDLGELEAVSVVLSGLPTPSGLAGAVRLREMLRNGTIRPGALVEQVVSVTARALERTSRYAPSQLCRPLGLLQAAGVTDADVDDQALHGLVAACRVTGTVVEISEAWRTPSVRLVRMLAEAGVHLAAASDATEPAMVGAWRFTRTIAESLTPAAPVT
jgi:putative hydrolase